MESKLSATAPEFVPGFGLPKPWIQKQLVVASKLCPDVPEFIPRLNKASANADVGVPGNRGRFKQKRGHGQLGLKKTVHFNVGEPSSAKLASDVENFVDRESVPAELQAPKSLPITSELGLPAPRISQPVVQPSSQLHSNQVHILMFLCLCCTVVLM